jgi:serine/threonine protein kinase/tetratricopeptide (TPR) repeat protein
MSSRTYPFALPRGTEISGYIIERVLGAGGFGITYAATNPVTMVTVAVKEFYPQGFASREGARVLLHSDVSSGSYEQALKKFEQEAAKLTARYSHPNIVRGINFLRANNTAYFIMEFVEGVSFDDWLASQVNVPDERQLRGIIDQVLDAVAYIHGRDGMHRDLTPRNIMVRPDGSAVLVDFGAAGEGLDTDRGVSTAFAQPNYAPPEQLAGDDSRLQGRHTDIFSLGGVLYKAIAGYPPVKPLKRSHEVAIAGPSADPYIPAEQAAQYPELYSLRFFSGIDAALRLDYRQRPATIEDLRTELGWNSDIASPADLPTIAMPGSPLPPGGAPLRAPPPVELAIPADLVSDADISAHIGSGGIGAVQSAPQSRPRPPIAHDYEDTSAYTLAPRRRGGLILTVTMLVGMAVLGALAWFFTTGDVPFRSMLAGQPHVAAESAKPPVDVPKPPVVADQPKPPEVRSVEAKPEPAKPEPAPKPKVDYAEFSGYSALGKELASSAAGTLESCRETCSDNGQCRAFTHSAEACTLYSDVTGLQPDPDHRLSVRADVPVVKRFRQMIDTEKQARASFKPIDGVTLAGGTASAKLSVSRDQCQFICATDGSCKAYTFASLVGACRTYAQVQPKDAKAAVGVVTVVMDPDGQLTADIKKTLAPKPRGFKTYSNLELNGPNVKHASAPDAAACKQTCSDDQSCIAATFADGDCARSTGVETVRSHSGAEGYLDTSDPKLVERVDDAVKRELKGDAVVLPGFDLLGNQIASDKARAAQTPEDCQATCKADQACTGYSFLHADRKCTIMSGVTDAVPDPSRTAGIFKGVAAAAVEAASRRIQLSEANRASFRDMPATCTPQGAGSTTQLGAQAVAEQCAYLCRSGQSCQGWVFNRNDHTCALLTSVTGAQAGAGLQSGLLDPAGKRVADLVRTCGPVPPGALVGTPANECDRQAGYVNDPELPKGIDPKPTEFIDPQKAITACQRAVAQAPDVLRWRVSLGRAFERAGRLQEARQAYLQAADDGSGPGAFLYAIMANKGLGGPQDDVEAERYFKLARARGFAPASTALGVFYTYGDRQAGPGDADALRLLEEAAQRGQANAMYRLGEAYERGRLNRRTVPIDPVLAQQWYQRAFDALQRDADDKDVSAFRTLSLMYDGGKGVPRDVDQSLHYLITYLTALYGPDNTQAQERGTVSDIHLDDWSVDTRRAFQQYLRDRGVFQDAANGAIGITTIDAVDKWLGLRG